MYAKLHKPPSLSEINSNKVLKNSIRQIQSDFVFEKSDLNRHEVKCWVSNYFIEK